MKIPKKSMAVTLFIGMAIVFAALTLAAKVVADPFAQQLMLSLGSSIFGAGLVFFMLRFSEKEG
jgi:hypothetical protein